ncbi:transcriptional regulator [Acidithiobacillus caldus]|uniref:transcriptional regulator n=1 Tax=Acidithiobacillus caldus TaxID=33059 RepID=UPI0009E44A3A|nr:helix-turn-helix domain-containing protein [Acidithiobacillus caldus]MBU2736402.1 helix-turn-helix domain-containing protein [Acidithiobacillus caldus ATCC 51756]MBU2743979.1 helix-turn-helix domain-containing protein [Acidithiobacillus caldus]MBU2763711.1 helix-turn-helix domain-containing protein [Acidithiobacillus caldus]MBU2771886.1 helix-turn-helix domain-containing protein [Acidithiobacillus caldus]
MKPNSALLAALRIAGSQRALARMAGVSQPAVHKWFAGKSAPGTKASIRIEVATQRAITREDLRPDIFGPISRPQDDRRGAA